MKNKKGFTLIELLAVIVILAIIMVIAVPQILNVINNSRDKAWDENVALIRSALQTNMTLANTGMAQGNFTTISAACTPTSPTTTDQVIKTIADYEDTSITCTPDNVKKEYTFNLTGSGQFADKSGIIICNETTGCRILADNYTYISPSGTSESFNPSWKTWIREDITTSKKEVCGKFNGGTVCFSGYDYDVKGYGDIIDNAKSAALVQRFADVGVTCSGSNHITCQEGNLTCTMCEGGYNQVICRVAGGNTCVISYHYGTAACE